MTNSDKNQDRNQSSSNSEYTTIFSITQTAKHTHSRYTSYRNSFKETTPFGVLIWDVLRVILIVTVVSSIVITLTGLSTPFVAVSSGSMEPNIMTYDLVITTAPTGSPPLASSDTFSLAVNESGSPNTYFNKQGSVIVFEANHEPMPVIHRIHHHTEQGENWVENVDSDKTPENVSCSNVPMCPAPHAGYITAGDNNNVYDQITEYEPVKEEDIIGVAEYRIPYFGILPIGINLLLNN